MPAVSSYLADTSAFTHIHHPEVEVVLAPLLARGLIATCGVVELEILFTARNLANLRHTRDERNVALERIETEERDFLRAAEVLELLAASGRHRAANIVDLVVAAVAERARLTVLHYDQDFDHVAAATGQPMRWIVPKGSIGA